MLIIMNREKFKINKNKYDLAADQFYNKVIKLITNNEYNISLKGSYALYGKNKACDMDFMYNVIDNKINKTKAILNRLTYTSDKYKKTLFIKKIKFDIDDERIKNTMNTLGYLDIHFNVINYNLVIDDTIPDDIKQQIRILATKYENTNKLEQYIELYMYLKSNLSPSWTIEELNNGFKEFNGIKYDFYKMINDNKITTLMIEMIYEKFQISCKLYYFKRPNMDNNIYPIKLNSIIYFDKNKSIYVIDYYKLLKHFYTFLKWAYFNKFKDYKIKDLAVHVYNNIYDFREKIGTINNKLCKYITYQAIVTNPNKLKKIDDKVDKYFNILNDASKQLFIKEFKQFSNYMEAFCRIQVNY